MLWKKSPLLCLCSWFKRVHNGTIGSLHAQNFLSVDANLDTLMQSKAVSVWRQQGPNSAGQFDDSLNVSNRVPDFRGAFGSYAHISKLCQEERLNEALQAAKLMDQQGIPVSRDIMYCLLQCCIKRKVLTAARQVRSLMVNTGLDSITFLRDHLIRLFALCGSLHEANEIFGKVAKPSIYTWNAIISAHEKLGEGKEIFKLFCKMQDDGLRPDKVTFLCILKASGSIGSLQQGRLIHNEVIEKALDADVVVGSTLVDMYSKCGSLEEARGVFDTLSNRNTVSWGAMITGYAQHGQGLSALELFQKMKLEGITPSNFTFSCILKACGTIGAVGEGHLIHDEITRRGLDLDVVCGHVCRVCASRGGTQGV